MELTEFREPMTRCHDLVDYDAGMYSIKQWKRPTSRRSRSASSWRLLLLIEDREAAVDQIRRAGDVVAVREARNTASPATSFGLPSRLSGICRTKDCSLTDRSGVSC